MSTETEFSTEFFMLPAERVKKEAKKQSGAHMFINQSYSLLFLQPSPREYANIVEYFWSFFPNGNLTSSLALTGPNRWRDLIAICFHSLLIERRGRGSNCAKKPTVIRIRNIPRSEEGQQRTLVKPPPLPGLYALLRRAFVSLSPHSNCANHRHTPRLTSVLPPPPAKSVEKHLSSGIVPSFFASGQKANNALVIVCG